MAQLKTMVEKVRSKNAGPFWVTIDIFCRDDGSYPDICRKLTSDVVAGLLDTPTQTLKRFDIDDLQVIKFSAPRPAIQGTREDRDMHGAQWACLLEELEL